MRILILLPCLTLGGAERQGFMVACFLKDQGHDVEVWGWPPIGKLATLIPELRSHGLRYEELPVQSLDHCFFRRNLILALYGWFSRWHMPLRKIAANLPKRKFDVIIPFTPWPSLIACLMKEKLCANKCFWNHRGGYDAGGVVYNSFLIKKILKHKPSFIANSKAGAKFLQDKFSLISDQVTIIHNAFVPDMDANLKKLPTNEHDSKRLKLIHVANFFGEKDYDTLLKAVQILDMQINEFELHVCGGFINDSDKSMFFQQIRELGIEKRIIFYGAISREKVFKLLYNSDIGLLSSRSEGQPNSVMEYMYAGLPVVATLIPGVQEVVGEENEKWLFDVGNAAGLASQIYFLSQNPSIMSELGRYNRKRIIEQFGSDKIIQLWSKIIGNE